MKRKNSTAQTPKELFTELQALAEEARTMMADSISETSTEALGQLRERFDAAQERFTDVYENTKKKVVAGARYTDATIRENPYQTAAIALGVGALLGVLLARRSK